MILQKIVYPKLVPSEECMYVRRNGSGVVLFSKENSIISRDYYNMIGFDTYFNTFSYKKWKKYTDIGDISLQLFLKGHARVMLMTLQLIGDSVEKHIVSSEVVSTDENAEFMFKYPSRPDCDMLAFNIQPLGHEVCIYDGAYVSDINYASLRDVNIGLAICAYRREDYVMANMTMLEKSVFSNVKSILHGHLEVFIADNGQTLSADAFKAKEIHLIPNLNSGGSGGFSRSAIEVMNNKSFNASHIILMDDDIDFECNSLERTYVFLRLLKKEYYTSLLGGAMFRSDSRFIQHAAGETCTLRGLIFNKIGYNMCNIVDVMRNEAEESINYLGWWYCCIPLRLLAQKQYSLPLFVQYDDIEFSLRCKDIPKITLNGICCWHLPFDKKWSASKNYYTIRNSAIVRCIHFDDFSAMMLKTQITTEVLRKLLQYSYNEANLALLAVEDFLKGMPWLVQQNPTELNAKVISMNDKLTDVSSLPMRFDIRMLSRNRDANQNKFRRILRMLTLNGWLLSANRECIVEFDNPPVSFFYRVKRVLKYDLNTGKALVVEKSYRKLFGTLFRLLKLCVNIDWRFSKVVKEYKKMYSSVITEEFWRGFLNMPDERHQETV